MELSPEDTLKQTDSGVSLSKGQNSDFPTRLSRVTLVGSLVLSLGLFASGLLLRSTLALSQAADSLLDVTGAVVLAFAVSVARQPRDERHPYGHSRAEPLGALAIAALASLLAFEVGKEAVTALSGAQQVKPDLVLLLAFGAKVVFKGVIFQLARTHRGAACEALAMDAKNDLLVGAVAVLGFAAAKLGWTSVDAWLALPVAVYIGFSGFRLARENVERLMGLAPSRERQESLLQLARECEGVQDAHDLLAHYLGMELSVNVHISVDARSPLQLAHDIGEVVRQKLEAEEDVVYCSVHIDPWHPDGSGPASHQSRQNRI